MLRRTTPIAGRTVVITGAASGIGRALAHRLSAAGSPVAISNVDEQGLEETESLLQNASLTRVVDVRDVDAVNDFAAEVAAWCPRPLGVVFNNAGVAISSSVVDGVIEDEDWLREINYHGVVSGTRAFLPILLSRNEGAIVNTSSVYGLIGVPYESAYCASKFAVRGFTDSLRQELAGTGVRAVTVHPGGIQTNIARNARVHGDPEGRGRTQEEIAEEFDQLAMTSPEKAAQVIHDGVERGKARILVGTDAKIVDAISRLTPTHYFGVISAMESILMSKPVQRATKGLAR